MGVRFDRCQAMASFGQPNAARTAHRAVEPTDDLLPSASSSLEARLKNADDAMELAQGLIALGWLKQSVADVLKMFADAYDLIGHPDTSAVLRQVAREIEEESGGR